MMDDNLMNANGMEMDIDLNERSVVPPSAPVLRPGSLFNGLESANNRVEERIRQLEAVTARAMQRQRWREARNFTEISSGSIWPVVNVGGVGCKRDSTHLVAKALEMNSEVKRVDDSKDGGSFFDCNICLDMARDPILSCCGHLFCWPCFYQLPYVDSTAKECPVCKGEVMTTNVTPIYGNGNSTCVSELECGLKIPPRPPAHRVESVRQLRVGEGVAHIPVAEALRRIQTGIGAMGEHSQERVIDGVNIGSNTNYQVLPNRDTRSSRQFRSRQISRVLSESAASLSSISSALNNAERLVEDLETYQFLLADNPSNSNAAAEINSVAPLLSSAGTTDVSAAVIQLENLPTDSTIEINLTVSRPSSSRRRNVGLRLSDVDNGVSRGSRSRRLR